MRNPFSEAKNFFSDAFAMQEQAADQQTTNQHSADTPQRHDIPNIRQRQYQPDSPGHSSESYLDTIKRDLLSKSIMQARKQRQMEQPIKVRAGGGTPIQSVRN